MKKWLLLLVIAGQLYASQELERNEYSFTLLTGQALQLVAPFMIQQRIEIMRDYPYLYEGNLDEEMMLMQRFIALPQAAVAVAYLHGEPIGFVSGTGFVDYESEIEGSCAFFQENGLDPKDFYYVPEAMIIAEHRGKSLFKALHNLIESHAKAMGYNALCLLSESHEQHPLKPVDYRGPDGAFMSAGYTKTSMVIAISPDIFPWPTRQEDGSVKIQTHYLNYWIKNF